MKSLKRQGEKGESRKKSTEASSVSPKEVARIKRQNRETALALVRNLNKNVRDDVQTG